MVKRVMKFVRIGGLAAVVLIGGGFALYTYLKSQASVVFFDNTTSDVVQLEVGGDELGSLNPGESTVVELDEGPVQVVATAGDREIVRETILH